ncbi:hypothetical protein HDU93_007641, partial [Gonapodya sp. JEL0774]
TEANQDVESGRTREDGSDSTTVISNVASTIFVEVIDRKSDVVESDRSSHLAIESGSAHDLTVPDPLARILEPSDMESARVFSSTLHGSPHGNLDGSLEANDFMRLLDTDEWHQLSYPLASVLDEGLFLENEYTNGGDFLATSYLSDWNGGASTGCDTGPLVSPWNGMFYGNVDRATQAGLRTPEPEDKQGINPAEIMLQENFHVDIEDDAQAAITRHLASIVELREACDAVPVDRIFLGKALASGSYGTVYEAYVELKNFLPDHEIVYATVAVKTFQMSTRDGILPLDARRELDALVTYVDPGIANFLTLKFIRTVVTGGYC